MMRFISAVLSLSLAAIIVNAQDCVDLNRSCREWVSGDATMCITTDYIIKTCRKACGLCGSRPKQYDVSRLQPSLQPLAFLIGRWRSEFGGKAVFPTIPKFTYGEQIDFAITDNQQESIPAINYTAFAWGLNDQHELHSEYGFLTIRPGTNDVALTTVMNNGFVTVEEGQIAGNGIRLRLQDIGRISFSRDLPVHDLVREWTLLNKDMLEARLEMETLTHPMQEHTFIRYNKVDIN